MSRVVFIFLFLTVGCGGMKHKSHKLTNVNFRGQVLIRTSKELSIKMDRKLPLKSELTIMKNDSSLVKTFLTDSLGRFNVNLFIDSTWNPLLIKIKGLENYFLDTLVSGVRFKTDFMCKDPISINIRPFFIQNNDELIIEIDCISLERQINPRQY